MKHTLYLLSVTFLLFSCDSFLNTELKGDYTSENYYKNQESCEQAVNGVYNGLYSVLQWQWVFGDVASDDAVKGGNAGDQAEVLYIDDFTARADNGMLALYWQALYEVIARANNVIAFVPGVNMEATLKARYVGEAKFLRAYAYFQLVNIYGKVPLKLKPQLTEDAIHVGLSETTAIYDQMVKDITEAQEVLPLSYSSTDAGRVTKGAALAMRAKIKLFQKQYADVVADITTLQGFNLYDLLKDYGNLFKAGAEDSTETLFAILFSTNSKVIQANPLNIWTSPSVEGGYYFDAPTQNYVDIFTESTVSGETDPRLDISIGRNGMPWFNGNTFMQEWSETGYLVKKYNEDMANTAGNKSLSVIPYHYIRYADVLLMKAEALNELGGPTNIEDACTALNEVRHRAGLQNVNATDQILLRNTIRNERRRELGFEFHRFFDLMRYGKETAEAALNTEGTIFNWGAGSTRTFYYPIPQAEIDANNKL